MVETVAVFGASNQLGQALLPLLDQNEISVSAYSRTPPVHSALAHVQWHQTELPQKPLWDTSPTTLIYAAPLGLLKALLPVLPAPPRRMIVFSSMSILSKKNNGDSDDEALVSQLQSGEQVAQQYADEQGVDLFILRPTLIYGGQEANLSRMVRLRRKLGFMPLPINSNGLRQPVYVGDLADCCQRIVCGEKAKPGSYACAGNEVLPYHVMIWRTLKAAGLKPRLIPLPMTAMLIAAKSAGIPQGIIRRMRQDLVADIAPTTKNLPFSPHPFMPERAPFAKRS